LAANPAPRAARRAQVHVRVSDRTDGDFAIDGPADALERRRAALSGGRPWVWLRQVHGAEVVTVTEASGGAAGASADAVVTDLADVVLAVQTADCAPLVLFDDGPTSVVAAVHAGWRGLSAGVVEAAVAACRALGAGPLTAVLGPCIGAECYEFGAGDLATLVTRFGKPVEGRTAAGLPALDLPAAVDAALGELGLAPAQRLGACTACTPDRWFSHRARRESARQATIVWRDPS
jgi:YfiH family protein